MVKGGSTKEYHEGVPSAHFELDGNYQSLRFVQGDPWETITDFLSKVAPNIGRAISDPLTNPVRKKRVGSSPRRLPD